MGYLHAGHVALMHTAGEHCSRVVATLFVNPMQFGPREDLQHYPRDIERDKERASEAGCSLLFAPSNDIMYPDGYQTTVSLAKISKGLCGIHRPGHFEGVATVVTKLFNLVQPDLAVFGEKDYQQLALLRQLVKDLDFDISILGHPIVREEDGLAMSSRNANLSPESRKQAVCLYSALRYAKKRIAGGIPLAAAQLRREIMERLASVDTCQVDYVEFVDAKTLSPLDEVRPGDLLALAAVFEGKVRLIDNIIL
ncbi:unnamed protein product [Cyprideis torosa]|uniref:Pantoate--beta-alanine ligase n=1 Tax=Cyprideis torosa TaxID=163714 RepID=A0A7R8WZS1_9CRUS|nr:unnamed protein product [Cyprideis torosa]CAG0909428.1 unnamed protein product [Cyprideis torosa]